MNEVAKYDEWRECSDEQFDDFFRSINFMNDGKNIVIDNLVRYHESGSISDELFNSIFSDGQDRLLIDYPDFFPQMNHV